MRRLRIPGAEPTPYERLFWCPNCNDILMNWSYNVCMGFRECRCEKCGIDMIRLPEEINQYVDARVRKLTKEDIVEILI